MVNTLDLGGVWKARWTDGFRGREEFAERDSTDAARYIDAVVPGEIHLDIERLGWIGDVRLGLNVLGARWVEEQVWSYRREFEAPAEALGGGVRAWLDFQGLDLTSRVVLNGEQIGTHNNSFYPCRIDVTGKLRAGTNVLAVHVESGLYGAGDKPAKGYDSNIGGKLYKRHWLRKPQCQSAWDWSPRLLNVGITKPVTLEWTRDALCLDTLVPLVVVSDDLAEASVRARVFVNGLVAGETPAIIEAEVAGVSAAAEVVLKPGLHAYEVSLKVERPKLWWPVGHGEQPLYRLQARVLVGGTVVAEKSAEIGFRHVRINQEKHPETGQYFVLEVNRKQIFVKGGNFVPADLITPRLDRKAYEELVELALEANFNMLRVWGGGMYESDDFYELCDRKGILVWQEFIFACSRYPADDPEFNENVKAEARFNVRRLAAHASLVVWCGNNEMEQGNWYWGYDRDKVHPDYALFHLTLPRLMREEDPTRFYWPSSPYTPGAGDPLDNHVGDQHPWSLGFTDNDFRKYRLMDCRFPNEGGSLGPTSLPTMLACLPEGHRFVQSFAWQVHDNSVDSWQEPSSVDGIMDLHLGRDIRTMGIEEFTYYGGLVQGEALSEYCDTFRRRMFSSAAAIFWMYNDTWPAVRSWTIVDYYRRRTPSFHPVRRSMDPLRLVLSVEKDEVVVWGVNERHEAVVGELRFGVMNLAGGYPVDRRVTAALRPNESTRLASFPLAEWADATRSLAFAVLEQQGKMAARARLFRPLFKEMHWPKAQVQVSVSGGQAHFSSDVFVWGVCLDLVGEQPLADNFFDVYPGQVYSIRWSATEAPQVVATGNLPEAPGS